MCSYHPGIQEHDRKFSIYETGYLSLSVYQGEIITALIVNCEQNIDNFVWYRSLSLDYSKKIARVEGDRHTMLCSVRMTVKLESVWDFLEL